MYSNKDKLESYMQNEYLTDGNGRFVLNQAAAEEFFQCNQATLRRWRDADKINFREVVSGVYYYIIDVNDIDADTEQGYEQI